MRLPRTLSAKLGTIGSVLLVMALISIGLTLWVTWQLEGGAAAVNEAGRMRMQTWRLAQALSGSDESRLRSYQDQFDSSVQVLAAGDPARPLFLPRDEATQTAFADVQQGWLHLKQAWGVEQRPSATIAAQQAEALVERVDVFVTAIEVQLAHLTAILNAFQFMMVALALASAVALLYAAYLFVFNPLARLQAGLEEVSKGDLSARVEVGSSDEFGTLSQGFNQMATTLQDLYQSLEDKVREKTLRLEQQRASLVAMYEAAAFVAKADSLEALTQGFARQLRRVAEADACAVRWADEHTQRYVLLASEGLPASLTDDEHCLPVGDCHCGQTKQQVQTRVIPIHANSTPGLRGHCDRAGFAAVVVIPLQLHDRRVGELNLFYRQPQSLSSDDQALLETLASHLAGAIESLRVSALEREAAVASERGLLASELHDSIAQSLAFLKIQTGLLRQALKRQDETQAIAVLAELDAGVAESMADVRELLVHFRTRTKPEDISTALQITLQKFEHQTGLKTHLLLEGEGLPLPPDVQVQVLHVVLEALSNVRKHSQARTVWVEVQQSPPWRVEVRDDGLGFDADVSPGETHVGLRIMRERAQRIGAAVELSSVPGSGTCVVLTLADPHRQAA